MRFLYKIGASLIPHPIQRHRQTPFSQIQVSARALREHQLFIFSGDLLAKFLNQESKNQRFLK